MDPEARDPASIQEHTINDGNAGLEEAQQGVLPADIAKGDKSADHFSRPISGTLKESPLFIELCCGSAILSSVVAKHGFEFMAIDFEGNKHHPYVHVVQLDLRKADTWEFLRFVVQDRFVFHVHAAPPCGTASRARDRRLSKHTHGPPPLRSAEFPLGFPWLSGVWMDKVTSANDIYLQLAEFCSWLSSTGTTWSIENPGNSYLWDISEYQALAQQAQFVRFHSCTHGGQRKKLTGFLTTCSHFAALEGFCQGDHEHLEWGTQSTPAGILFDTSKEAAYPRLLCTRIAALLSLAAAEDNLCLCDPSHVDSHPTDARVAAGKQPRGHKLQPLIPEYNAVRTVCVEAHNQPFLNDKKILLVPFADIPLGSKLLRTSPAKRGEPGSDTSMQTYVFGVFHSMIEFVDRARALTHPFDSYKALPDSMLRVVFNVLTNSPLVIMKRRLETLQRWRTWAGELEEANRNIFQNMDPGCASVLKGKHLALLEKIATELQWPDVSVHKEIRDGFRLVGLQKPSGVFSKDVKHRTLSERELLSQSKHIKPALWGKISSAPATEYQQDLWDITMQEVREKHWLQGPFSFEELEVMFDGVWMPVRRFAVWQRSKWRPIDDYTECGVNASFGYLEKIDLRALDQTVWVASCLIRHAIHLEFAEFRLSTGEVLRAPVDKHWKRRHSKEFVLTKTVDLKSAYKQLPISPIDRKLSILTLKSPRTGEVQGFVSRTLPFGSAASVLHFNRVARLLHRIGVELDVNWSNYFDDFPVVEFDELCQSTSGTIRALTHLLGFECSPDKEEPFSSSTHTLGMCLDTSSSHEGFVKVRNREDRTRELKDVVQDIIRLKCVQPKLLPSLFGRALFAESFFMGRAGRLALSELRHLEYSRKPRVELSKSQLDAFQVLFARYTSCQPRVLRAGPIEPPVIVFTDGACEEVGGSLQASVGGVLLDPREPKRIRTFGCFVPREVLESWTKLGKVHPVCQTELFAVVLARREWKDVFDGRRTIFFIDNQGGLDACIKGYSTEDSTKDLLISLERLDAANAMIGWFARVPSSSNIADLPSRGCWKSLRSLLGPLGTLEVVEPFCFVTHRKLGILPESSMTSEQKDGVDKNS